MEHGAGVEFTVWADLDVGVDHHTGMDGAAGSNLHIGPDHHERAHMAAHANNGARVDHGAGVDARGRAPARVEHFERLGEAKAGIGQGNPGQAPLACQLLQRLRPLTAGRDQHRARAGVGQGRRQGVAGLEKSQLPGPGLV